MIPGIINGANPPAKAFGHGRFAEYFNQIIPKTKVTKAPAIFAIMAQV